ncbi:hypothetical protein LSCM1_06357 [Leishmania martiniquensis]|uniref:DUF1736 domain-containing protein n=1 Tax=Leishmania martiniquensis TaxID=1580590 RepID=A0A836GTN9_9TRYP|nr:hypothetical protein LSCM1_06357 [Leishmania martiniquensis]
MAIGEAAGKKVPVAERLHWRLAYPTDVYVHSLVLVAAAVIFNNGIFAEMTFDDHLAIERNADSSANETSLGSLFYNDFWGKPLISLESNGSYRPITVLTFRLQNWLMGYRHIPAFLHSFNYTVAYLNVCLVFYLARVYVHVAVPSSLLSAETAKVNSLKAVWTSSVHAVPLMAALVYLVHPVHVDAVTSIVGRCELLYCFFGLIGFFCIHRYLNQVDEMADATSATAAVSGASLKTKGLPAAVAATRKGRAGQKPRTRLPQCMWAARYVVFAACMLTMSVLCKDSAITFTAIYSVHACVMYACGRCQRPRSLLVIGVSVLELASYILFRRQFIGDVDLEKSRLLRQTENPQYFVPKGLFHWLGIRWVIQVKNLELLFFPTSLCCEYSFNCIPHMHNMDDPRLPYFLKVTGAALAALVGLLYGTFVFHSRVALVGLVGFLWMAIPYAPVSHLFIAVGTFIAERCLYVPSIGSVLLITFMVAAPGLREGVVKRYFYALLLLCIGWGMFSYRRNEDWMTDERLFRSAMRTCPNSGKVYAQLASIISARESRITPEVLDLAKRSMELDDALRGGYFYLAAHELNDNYNVKKAYRYLRICMRDPFSIHSCRRSYELVRRVLFPNMTEVDYFLDDASLVRLESQKATYLQQAGHAALKSYQRPCLAQQLFSEAMHHWNNSKLYWLSDEVSRMTGATTYCGTLYWYEQVSLQCEALNGTDISESPSAEDREDSDGGDLHSSSFQRSWKNVPLTPQEAVQRALILAERFRPCDTDWRQVLSGPKYNLLTIPDRMTMYITVGDSTSRMLARYASHTGRDTPERREVLLALLDVAVRQYCHVHTVMKDAYVRKKIGSRWGDLLQIIERGFPQFRLSSLAEMRRAQHELEVMAALNAAQQDARRHIASMASCSSDLSFLAL